MSNTSIIGESANEISRLISNINVILEYYIPGFCLVFIYRRFRSNNSSGFSETIQFGICIAISYLLHVMWMAGLISLIIGEIGVVYFVVKKTLSARKYAMRRDLTCSILFAVLFGFGAALLFLVSHNNEYARVVYKVIIAIILALDLVLLHEEKLVKYAFNWVNNTTLCETVFECSQMELPCDVIVYEDGKRIEGRLLNYDLAADDAWILLDIYMIFDDNGKVIGSWECEAKYHQLLVPLSEVKCIKVDADHGRPTDYDEKRILSRKV